MSVTEEALPADIIGAAFLSIAAGALSITDIMVISKAVTTDNFKGTCWKKR